VWKWKITGSPALDVDDGVKYAPSVTKTKEYTPIVAHVKLFCIIATNHCEELWRIIVIAPVTQVVRTAANCSPCLSSKYIIWTDELETKWRQKCICHSHQSVTSLLSYFYHIHTAVKLYVTLGSVSLHSFLALHFIAIHYATLVTQWWQYLSTLSKCAVKLITSWKSH